MVSVVVSCKKKVSTERSQASLCTTKLFRKLQQEELAAKERTKEKLLILAYLLSPYRANGCAACLPFSIGTVRPYRKNSMAVVHTTAMVTAFYSGSTV